MKLVFVWLLVAVAAVEICIACTTPATQVTALKQFFNSTNGTYWQNNRNWGVGDPCNNKWYGIYCQNCQIQSLHLNNNNLTGEIPSTIGKLVDLTAVYLNSNNLTGVIPASIGQLDNVLYLHLENNNFTGVIPATIGNMTMATDIYLQNNNFTGSIPKSILDLVYLEALNFGNNSLNGTVPWKQNPNFSFFNATDNLFACPLPAWCSPPPTGNGACAPCKNVVNGLVCCNYSDMEIDEVVFSTCAQGTECPDVVGLRSTGQSATNDCSKCFPRSDEKIKIIV